MGRQKSFLSFMGIPLEESLVEEIIRVQNSLRKLSPSIIWEKPEKLHITIAYLGKVSDSSLYQLTNSLSKIIDVREPIFIKPSYVDYFYKKHDDSVIYLGLSDDEPIRNLELTVRKTLFDLKYSPPLRYQPHITIGKIKRLKHPNQLKDILYSLKQEPLLPFSPSAVTQLVFYQSTFSRDENTSQFIKKSTLPLIKQYIQ